MDLGAVGLGDRPGKAGPGPSGRGARLVSRRASPEPGVGGVRSGPGSAGGAVWPASHPAEGRPEPDRHRGIRAVGGGPARRLARVEGDPLLEETLRGGTTAVQLFQVPWCTAGERCDREHDSPGDQPSTQGERHLLDGGQCGSGVPTAGCRRIRALGRDRGTHAGSDGEGPPNGLALDTTGVSCGVERAR